MRVTVEKQWRDKAKAGKLACITVDYDGREVEDGRWTFQNAMSKDRAFFLVTMYRAINENPGKSLSDCVEIAIQQTLNAEGETP
jgi:hypothetical protein